MRWWRSAPSAAEAQAAPQGAPDSYAQWSDCLDRLARGDDDAHCLQQMLRGRLSWTGGVAPLFVERLNGEVNRRLHACADRLARDLRLSADETHVVRALLQARQQLGFIHQLCVLPVLPEDVRSQLAAEVNKFAERSQRSLLDTAQADRSGRLASLVRNNPLPRYAREAHADAVPTDAAAPTPTGGAPRRRQILF